VEPPHENLDAFTGSCAFGSGFLRPGAEAKVVRRDGHLSIEWAPDYLPPLLPLSPARHLDWRFWAFITFTRVKEGKVTGLTWEDPDVIRAEKTDR